jgi:hypothetical protein
LLDSPTSGIGQYAFALKVPRSNQFGVLRREIRRYHTFELRSHYGREYLIEGNIVRVVAGFRFADLLYCGKIPSVDDLVADEHARSGGYEGRMLYWPMEQGRTAGCADCS